jgi:RHS repeat-associated protein
VDYWSKAEIKKAHVRGKIKDIVDHSGSVLKFDYYDDGNLLRLTQVGGTNADGTFLADRSFVFTYTTSNGAGPAIPAAADRVNPDSKTPNESTRLYSVRDPRGSETTYAYYQANDGAKLRWKLKSRTDRDGQTTGYAYDITNQVTTVNAPLSRTTKYGYDTTGKITSITNALSQTTGVQWTGDFKVSQVTEPTGKLMTYTYNANGYLTSQTNEVGEKTELTYLDQAVDANDSAKHLSLLSTVTNPKGVATATAGDYQWRFSYDGAGNLDKATDPTGAVTDYDYNGPGSANPGTLAAIHDADGHPPTTYPAYDPSGQATQITDPLGNTTRVGYDVDGNAVWIQDPDHAGDSGTDERSYKTFFDYDSFGRLGQQSAPKSTATDRGTLLWSGVTFDANDNTVAQSDPHFGPITGDPGTDAVTKTSYDAMDRQTLITGPDTSADPAGQRTAFDFDAAGRLVKVTQPKGVASSTTDDYATITGYDALDRAIKQTVTGTSATQERVTQMCYDVAGDLRSVTAPRAGTDTITCPGNGPAAAAFTTTYDYDAAHRRTTQRDALGHTKRVTYDADGNVATQEQDIDTGRVTHSDMTYNQRDALTQTRQLFDASTGRTETTQIEYDANGNRSRLISPRASDAGGSGPYTNYVTAYNYDADNRLVRTDLPFDSRDGSERQYVHQAYDPNGNLLWSSLPVTSSSPADVADTARTVMTYFDPGWVRTSDDPNNPKVHFDYSAQGWQTERVPETSSGALDDSKRMTWDFYLDGQIKDRKDQGGQPSTFTYDANNNLLTSTDAGGVTDPSEHVVETQATYTGFNEVAKTRHQKQGDAVWTFTNYTYDDDGNVTVRQENGEENDGGTQTKAPRRYELTYDGSDWLTQQLDLGTDSSCTDDSRTVTTYWSTGTEKERDTYRGGSGCGSDPTTWPKKQTSTWDYFDNGKLRHMETRNGSDTVTESHDVGYLDSNNVYIDGNRTSDHYVLQRADGSTATTCTPGLPCDAQYQYDARDRLIQYQPRAGHQTTYALDEPAKLIGDTTIRAGNITTETKDGQTTSRRYTGQQLTDLTAGSATAKYWYDPNGNVDCVTTSAGSQSNCSPSDGTTPSNLIADYGYDYLNRMSTSRLYSGTTQTDTSKYTYDALDRTTKETEDHAGTTNDRTTNFDYQGLTNLVTQEQQSGGADPQTKTYAYDSYGHRISLTDKDNNAGTTDTYTYGTDVHGSVSQLITDSGKVKASYGYDPYGGTDSPSTDSQSLTTGDTNAQAPLNPYRFSNKRLDSGTAPSTPLAAPAGAPQYDMGARRFGPDLAKFIQQDTFASSLGNLGLALDPLTQNRYSLAGGNPISYVEFDGHMVLADGGGGASPTPNPTPNPSPTAPSSGSGTAPGWWGTVTHALSDAWGNLAGTAGQVGLSAADFANDGIVGGLGDLHIDILKKQSQVLLDESKQLEDHYLKTPGGTAQSEFLNKQIYAKFLESDKYALEARGLASKLGSRLPIVGLAITAASIGYDIHQGKPAGKAIISGVGGALAAAGTGALIGTAIGGPVGTVVGAGAGLIVGAITSGALDEAYDHLPQGVQDGIENSVSAVGNGLKDAGGAIASGAKSVWNSIF